MGLVRILLCSSLLRATTWAVIAVLVGLAAPDAVQAAPNAQQRALARELYGKGQQLFREGDYANAERSFEEAYRVVPNPVVLLSIAECQVRTEQFEKAIASLESYLREKPDARDKAEVNAQLEKLRTKPGTLAVGSNVPGAQIWIDGADSSHSTPADVQVAPGEHMVTLVQDGYVRAEQAVRLTPGGRETVRITLMPEAPEPVAATPEPEPAPVEENGPRRAEPAFWVATGVGVAGLATGIGLGVAALKKEDDYNANPNPTKKMADKGERLALFADVGFAIAGAAAVTALVLYLTSGNRTAAADVPQQAWFIAPSLAPGRAGAAAEARF